MLNNLQFNPLISATICLNKYSPAVECYDNLMRHFSECFGLHIQIDGSPLQYPELESFLIRLKQNKIENIGIRTGTRITKRQLQFLKDHNIRSILFRYDMSDLEYNIKKAQKYDISTEVSILISKETFSKLPLFLEQYKAMGIDLLVIERSIVAEYRHKKVSPLNSNDYYNLLKFIMKHNHSSPKLKIAVSHCPNKILFHADDAYAKMAGGCSGGIISCAIDWNGDIIPCLPLWKIVLGNICTDDFISIWNSSPILAKLRNRDNLEGKCGQCSLKISCGGCRAESYKFTKSLFKEDSTCWK